MKVRAGRPLEARPRRDLAMSGFSLSDVRFNGDGKMPERLLDTRNPPGSTSKHRISKPVLRIGASGVPRQAIRNVSLCSSLDALDQQL